MKKTCLVTPLVIATLAAALQPARAEHENEHFGTNQLIASELIGMKVKNTQDEDLGKVQDLILDLNTAGDVTVPYVIIAHGGILGAGRTKTAVPMGSFRCSGDGKALVLAATKEQLQAASRTASGEWASITNASWARSVDGFYGQPRDSLQDSAASRRFVRDSAPKGAELLMQPADKALCERICEAAEIVQVQVNNGVTYLYGRVPNEAVRDDIEAKVKAVPGVQKVENHLQVKNP